MIATDDLRDLMAAVALAGIMAKAATTTMSAGTRKAIADLTWQIADDVLEARDKVEVASQQQDEGFPNYDKTLKRWDEQ
jgi:hypothetical protein